MIKNVQKLNKFYKELIKKEKISYKQSIRIYEALHKEAVSLGVINRKNILDGLDIDLKVARIINGLI